ncbi:agglutinin biogenesis protein MshP [Alteromonas mediterranea]|uniref:pilus assembly PilX family protein n=1 Tax=Alteromonas mediterranea TaxID=314275 RepID=UPI0009038536|nr:agglutinin biogenesis protein MshP [Alteromonas mediterranea]APD92724.1 agglutinin biogenesis protein MshP [Alteromonas mediterranea]APD96338.1 agglutinin biogenesis protein MshP [Alteromonas mediterranea]QGX60389.1 agglutinin biogenesis protein MshP [Alteromonas mediterranea]
MCLSKSNNVIKPSSGPRLVAMPGSLARQRGATTIVAIIISIVLLGLGIALSNQISSNIRQQSIEYYGARAYLAAQSGMEVAISRLINGNNPACSAITQPVTISAANVQNCVITLSCEVETEVQEPEVAAGEIRVYALASQAQCSIGQLETSKRVLVEVRQEE